MKSWSLATIPRDRTGRHRRRSTPGSVLALGAVAATTIFAAGCEAEQSTAPETCSEIVKTAAYEQEVEDEVKWFDLAIQRCDSYGQLKTEMERYDLRGYTTERFLEKRCTDEAETLAKTDVCLVAAPPTTLPQIVENPEYSGKTLDGRVVTVKPPEVEFEGAVPAQVKETVDLASQGCVAVLGVRDDMAQFVTPAAGRSGDIASMYAQHAQSVAAFIGCQIPPVITGPTGPLPPAPSTSAPAG